MRVPPPISRLLRHRTVASALVIAAAVAVTVVADAAKSPFKPSIDCRGRIADQAKGALGKALAGLDACHRARDKGDRSDDCNALPLERGKLPSKIAEKCPAGDPVLLNYQDGDAGGQVATALEDVVRQSGKTLEDSPPLTDDPVAAKCRAAIGKARTKIVKDVVKRSVACQKSLDKTASEFGPLAATCMAGPNDGTVAAAAKTIGKACRRKLTSKTFEPITGASIGSCDPLPACVATAATATGKAAAASIYKAPLGCGDTMRTGPNLRSFISRVFLATHNALPRFGSFTKVSKPPAGAGIAPAVSFRSSSIVSGGGRQFRIITKTPGGSQSVTGDRALPLADADRLWVVAGPENASCFDVYTVPLANGGGDPEDIDFETEFVDDLGSTDLPIRFALGDANGPLTAYATALLKPTGGFLRQVRDIRPGAGGSNPHALTDVGGTLFFVAAEKPAAPRIWKTDGSEGGTLARSPEQFDLDLRDLTAVESFLYFTKCLGASCGILRTDGTSDTPTLVAGVNAGVPTPVPTPGTPPPPPITTTCEDDDGGTPVAVGSTMYFASDSRFGGAADGCELWRSDGPNATHQVVDIDPDFPGSAPRRLTPFGESLLFLANDGTHGLQVWRTNRADDGTSQVTSFAPGADLRELTVVGDAFFFTLGQTELWRGTTSTDPKMIATLAGVTKLTRVGTRLFFVGCDVASGCELWRSDGSEASTFRVRDILPGSDGSDPDELTDVGGTLFFSATDGDSGRELWRSDGSEAFTFRVRDILPGSGGSDPADLTNVAGVLVFVASDGSRGREVWQSDGTEDGTDRVRDFAVGAEDAKLTGDADEPRIVAAGNIAYFVLDDGNATGAELYALKPFLDAPPPPPTPTPAPSSTPTPAPTVTAAQGSCCTAHDPQNPAPACDDAACGSCVCTFDPFCCTVTWDAICASEAAQDCPEPCPCAPPATPTPEPTPTSTPALGSCCAPHETTGCEVRTCQDCICGADPFCCVQSWDQTCAIEASGSLAACSDACQVCIVVATPTPTPVPTTTPNAQSCCVPHPEIGCDDQLCAGCVCGADPFCCSQNWDSICASEASGSLPACNEACAVCAVAATPTPTPLPTPSPTPTPLPTTTPGSQTCCAPHPETGCDVQQCADCVCAGDAFCCNQNWDSICASEASGAFPACSAACGACAPPTP